MKKHSQSNTGYCLDFITNSRQRSFTPSIKQSKKINLPSISDENRNFNLNRVIEKKYSILNVPKPLNRENNIFRDFNFTPKLTETIDTPNNFSSPSEFMKTEKISLARVCKIRKSYRFSKNPNQEALKSELEKLQTQSIDSINQKNSKNVIEREPEKSDIEKLLESQEFFKKKQINKNWKKPGIFIDLNKLIEGPIEELCENESQKSDPSPVKENIERLPQTKSQTPTSMNKFSKKNISILNILSETKAGKEILEKINEDKKKKFKKFIKESPKFSGDLFYDYKQESLKILKSTAFLAEKIMKGIRCGGRIKNVNV